MIYLSNLVASAADDRDYPYAPLPSVPVAASLKDWIGGIENQGGIGSCTANSVVSACELLLTRAEKSRDLSRLFNYYLSRELDGRLGQEGVSLRTAVRVANKVGIPTEDLWPYVEANDDIKPPQVAYDAAQKINRYERVTLTPDDWQASVKGIKSAIAEGYPVVIAMPLTNQFLTLKGPVQNYLGVSALQYHRIGNHAMCVVGYDSNYFYVENSWGYSWGDNGVFKLPITLINEIFEAWVICGYSDVNAAPAVAYKTDPMHVIGWYHNVGRTDVTDPNDPNVQYWARDTSDPDVFYGTFINIARSHMRVPI